MVNSYKVLCSRGNNMSQNDKLGYWPSYLDPKDLLYELKWNLEITYEDSPSQAPAEKTLLDEIVLEL